MSRISLERIEEASRLVDPVFRNTPQFHAEPLSEALGAEVWVKVETLNPIRSFKGRGTDYYFVRHPEARALVCASAGNFGQGMAYGARKRGAALTVFASETANPLKLERMRAFGASVVLEGADFDAAKMAARKYAGERGLAFVEDSRDAEFTEGAGTIAVELLQAGHEWDAVLVPLGNGALIAGIGRWIKAHKPAMRVIGVCAAGAPAMERSWRRGTTVTFDRIDTIADGIGVRVPVPEALGDLRGQIDDIILVDDASMLRAMRLIHQHLGLVVEPSGAAAMAAVPRFPGFHLATVLCGGNLTAEQMRAWLAIECG